MSPWIGKSWQIVYLHREINKSTEELKINIPAVRQYIDATVHLAPVSDGVWIS